MHILQQDNHNPDEVAAVAHWVVKGAAGAGLMEAVADQFSELEVATALARCIDGKACGPDCLINGWDLQYALELVPIIICLYNRWYEDGIFPKSFLQADIFCLKKAGANAGPLKY